MPINSIIVGNRFRKNLGDIKALADSIREVGLLQPITTDENNNLICGQRRIEAFNLLGYKDIPVHVVNLKNILIGELHENVDRKDFTFSEIVEIRKAIEPIEKKAA